MPCLFRPVAACRLLLGEPVGGGGDDWPVISNTTNRFTKKRVSSGHGPEKTGQEANGHWLEKNKKTKLN